MLQNNWKLILYIVTTLVLLADFMLHVLNQSVWRSLIQVIALIAFGYIAIKESAQK